jgi:hypothetical protein
VVKIKREDSTNKESSIYQAYKKGLITKKECVELLEIKGFDIISQLLKCDILNFNFFKKVI